MKTPLLIATGTAALLMAINTVSGAEPFLSPRAQANLIRVVPGSSAGDVNLAAVGPIGNAKAWALAQSFRTVPASGADIDLAHGPRPAVSPKDPRFEQAARRMGEAKFQVAPLK